MSSKDLAVNHPRTPVSELTQTRRGQIWENLIWELWGEMIWCSTSPSVVRYRGLKRRFQILRHDNSEWKGLSEDSGFCFCQYRVGAEAAFWAILMSPLNCCQRAACCTWLSLSTGDKPELNAKKPFPFISIGKYCRFVWYRMWCGMFPVFLSHETHRRHFPTCQGKKYSIDLWLEIHTFIFNFIFKILCNVFCIF